MTALAKLTAQLQTRPRRAQIGPIGLHFAEDSLHAVQLRRLASGAYCLRAWASVPYRDTREDLLSSPKRLQRVTQKIFKENNFKGHQVVTAMPPEQTRITSLNFQVDSRMSDAERILHLMGDRLSKPVQDYVIDYLPVRGVPGDKEKVALVTACAREDIVALLQTLQQAGLKVQDLDVGPAALNRLVCELPQGPEHRGNVLLINYGAERTYLTLISGRRLLMDKEVEFGSRMLIDKIVEGLDVDKEFATDIAERQGLTYGVPTLGEAAGTTIDSINPVVEILKPSFGRLVDELRRACLYAASESKGEAIDQVYTFGSIARWAGANELLNEMANIPVADSLPITAIFDTEARGQAKDFAAIGPELAIATGLALRGLADDE